MTNAATVSTTFLLVVLLVATRSRFWEAAITSVTAMLCFNYFFLPPVGTWTIADPHNWVALLRKAPRPSGRGARRAAV